MPRNDWYVYLTVLTRNNTCFLYLCSFIYFTRVVHSFLVFYEEYHLQKMKKWEWFCIFSRKSCVRNFLCFVNCKWHMFELILCSQTFPFSFLCKFSRWVFFWNFLLRFKFSWCYWEIHLLFLIEINGRKEIKEIINIAIFKCLNIPKNCLKWINEIKTRAIMQKQRISTKMVNWGSNFLSLSHSSNVLNY